MNRDNDWVSFGYARSSVFARAVVVVAAIGVLSCGGSDRVGGSRHGTTNGEGGGSSNNADGPPSDSDGNNADNDGVMGGSIYASDYGTTCKVDFDCELVWFGGEVCECALCGPYAALSKSEAQRYREAYQAIRDTCTNLETCGSLETQTVHQATSCETQPVPICVEGACELLDDPYEDYWRPPGELIVRANDWVTLDIESGTRTIHDASLAPDVVAEDWDVSPDGDSIVYAQPGNAGALLVMGPSDFSSEPQVIFRNAVQTGTEIHSPTFGWGGTRVIFFAGQPDSGLTVWTIGVHTGPDQPAAPMAHVAAGSGFQPIGAMWNRDRFEALSRVDNCATADCPTHVGVLEMSGMTGTVTKISGDVDGWTLAQMANEPSCNGTVCNVVARNGGGVGEREFGWLIGATAVYRTNRDRWNSWDGGTTVEHGSEGMLTYSIFNPLAFEDQYLERNIGAGAPWDVPGIPRAMRSSNSGDFVTFLRAEEGYGVRVYQHGGVLLLEHTASFSASNPPRSARFAAK